MDVTYYMHLFIHFLGPYDVSNMKYIRRTVAIYFIYFCIFCAVESFEILPVTFTVAISPSVCLLSGTGEMLNKYS
jgi:hypothetical protein